MADDFAARYAGLLTGSYDCVDRIVLNAYYPLGSSSGGFRAWWRRLIGGSDAEADVVLDNTHLMRLAGRFARRVRAWAADNAVPVIDCTAGERKHLIAEEYLHAHSVGPGVFMVLIARAPAMVWEVRRSRGWQRDRQPGQKAHLCESLQLPHHGLPVGAPDDQDGRACAVRRAGHPERPRVCGSDRAGRRDRLTKEGNCFTGTTDPAGLAQIADILSQDAAAGRLGQVIDRWICTACLILGLDLADQQRTCFAYAYSVYQAEYSRDLLFAYGGHIDRVFNAMLDRTRFRLDIPDLRTLFGARRRPGKYGTHPSPPARPPGPYRPCPPSGTTSSPRSWPASRSAGTTASRPG